VVADIAKLSVGREAYYTRELATDHEQYLSGHGESPGRWYGAGASSLGLQGEASAAGFQRMFEGRDPTTGELLSRPHGRNAVPAFDMVLRPTKSVSILYGLGDPATGRTVLAAHHAGLAEAVAYLDGQLGARRGHGGHEHVSSQGLLAVGFDHRTSREGDPLLHTHLVIANRVQGPDGRLTALDGRDLYRHRLAADAIYQATYQRELVRTLGVEWTAADGHGNRELQGIPEALIRSFSKRTDQIDAELDRLTEDGRERTPRLVKWTVQATRKPKEHETPDTLYGRWRQEAAERGHDADALVWEVTGRTPDRPQDRTVSDAVVGRLFDRLAGPEGLTEHASTFTRPDVLVALGAGLAGAGRTELEELADRFLAERTVSVVADRTLEERRWSTPDLLGVEDRLVAAATGRTGEQTAVASHPAVREALAAHPTAGADQQAMVRDVCQGGAGVALVVGRAGTGKTFALGIARHAWQLDGYRLLAAAPTGIAALSLQGEGFEDVATCDRLLCDLDRGTEQLDARTVLVIDEAGMVGSRKLTRLLEHAHHAQAKVVLVGDDRQLAAIDAGGGFRALRLRLGASELVENRRQQQAWEREALELVCSGLVDDAVAAYQAHDRVVAADSKPAATLALLQDWWTAWEQAEDDPAQEVVVLAARRAEVDRLNTACQELLAAQGCLGAERLQVEDRQLAVGDRVVCGHNAIAELGVANGSRGAITALDVHARTLTIRLDGSDGRTVTLPRAYLDGRGRGEPNRRVDLAYATTGHRAQGLTRGRALVRLTGGEDVNWLYVQLSRARQDTRLYAVVGPEPQGGGELDLPDRDQPDGYLQLAQALSRAGGQTLAIDTPSSLDLRRLSTAELRAERDRLRHLLDQAPRDRSRELQWTTARRAEADAAWSSSPPPATMSGRGGDASPAVADHASLGRSDRGLAGPPAGRARPRRRAGVAPHQQQRRAGWLEANAHLGPAYRQVVRELAWQRRAHGLAAEHNQPDYLRRELGPVPESTRGRRVWRQAAAIEDYRRSYGIADPEQALGQMPGEPAQRAAWQQARQVIDRAQGRQRRTGRDRQPQRGTASRPATNPLRLRGRHAPAGSGAGRRLAPPGGDHATAPARPRPRRPLALLRRPPTWGGHQAAPTCQSGRPARPPRPAPPGPGLRRPPGVGWAGAGTGSAGAGERRPARRLGRGRVPPPAGRRASRLDRIAALAGRHRACRRVAAWLLAAQVLPGLSALAGVIVAAGLAWLLRFRVSADTVAWRRGAAGERRTARLLAPLERCGWAVLHDLAIPGTQANIDHLIIGPGGVLVIDSKQYRGQLWLDRDGMVWHGRHLLVSALRKVLWQADQVDEVLGIADLTVAAIVAVHGAWVPWDCMQTDCVSVVPARRVPDLLQALPPILGPERVAWLADRARLRFRPAT
jgi:conjugative relaxase-like TrwC/TraI family protein